MAQVADRRPGEDLDAEAGEEASTASSAGAETMPLACADPREYFRRVKVLYGSAGAVILGNILEWYDWTVYGYMEDVLSPLFLNGNDTAAWLVFAVPFVARPLGSVLLGWVGDTMGRTVALNLAIWGMALSTVLQGCLVPGIPGAGVMLASLRVLSGLSAGGEAAGVNTYMTELGGEDRDQTLVAAVGVNNVSGSMAFFLANVISLLVHQLPREAQLAWGWRVPFLMAAPLGIASVIMRRNMPETEVFKKMQEAKDSTPVGQEGGAEAATTSARSQPTGGSHAEGQLKSTEPCGGEEDKVAGAEGCAGQLRATVIVVVVIAAINCCNYMPVYLARWLQKRCGFSATMALSLAGMSKVVQALMTGPVSFIGDRVGATATMLGGGVACVLTILPTFLLILQLDSGGLSDAASGPSAAVKTTAFLLLGLLAPTLVAFYNIPCTLFMTSLFPPAFRGRGAGLGLGLAALAGGFSPMICTLLANHRPWYPGLFVTLLAVPSLVVLACARMAARRGQLPVYQRPWLF